jgi:hypothetical protein
MGPLDHREFEIHGMDSWQALEQGMNHAAVLAQHYHGKGWRYLWERGGEEALPSELACGTAKF